MSQPPDPDHRSDADHRSDPDRRSDDHWLVRPATIRKLWWGLGIVLALTVAAQAVISIKGYFTVDGWFGFGAVFGFLACLLMVLGAKALGFLIKRDQDYYRADTDAAATDDHDHA